MSNRTQRDNNESIAFVSSAIKDSQEIIKGIDLKLNIVLIFLIIPFTNLGNIYNTISSTFLHYKENYIIILSLTGITFVFGISWIMAFISTAKGIVAIDNPKDHITKQMQLEGVFYSGGLYKTKFIDIFHNRKNLKSNNTFEQHVRKYPNTKSSIKNELIFEHMKVAYIRTMKLLRQKWAYIFVSIWIALGGILWIFVLTTKSKFSLSSPDIINSFNIIS